MKIRTAPVGVFCLLICTTPQARAHQPFIEPAPIAGQRIHALQLDQAVRIQDPTRASLAVYGALSSPEEADLYRFTAEKKTEIPVEVLVPVRSSNKYFRPSLAVITRGSGPETQGYPFSLPEGFSATVVRPPREERREFFFEPFSLEKHYRGREATIAVEQGETYYLAVFEEGHYTGDYALGIGEVEDFRGVSLVETLKRVAAVKLGLVGGRKVPWLDLTGLFLVLAGFVVGLGAVTVIDLHGFLGRKSPYWTEATTRTHKVTKPLIWAGMFTAIAGGMVLYRESGLSGAAAFQAVLAAILVLNGLFLTFRVSPFLLDREREGKQRELLPAVWQRKIILSFLVSIVGWWGSLLLLVWHVLMLR
jgi:hypothetical protein